MARATPGIPESAWADALGELGYFLVETRGVDFATSDESAVVEILQRRRASLRDLGAAVSKLAVHIAPRGHIRWACLILTVGRMTEKRLRHEWKAILSTLRPAIAERLALIALGNELRLCLPEGIPLLESLAAAGRRLLESAIPIHRSSMPKPFVVLKVLLVRWLLGEGPISRRELGEQSGCSYPTVAKAVNEFGRSVRRHRNGSVEFVEFPPDAWTELLARVPSQRSRLSYEDRSGRPPDLDALLHRLEKLNPPGLALGGVLAAQHWDPHFDLRGVPRIDLSLDASSGLELGFLRKLDPALRETSEMERGTVLVVHPLDRPASLFIPGSGGRLPIVDPVETLLDLNEMRLVDQANALVSHLEREQGGYWE